MKPIKYQRGWVWGTVVGLLVIAGVFLGAASLLNIGNTQAKVTQQELPVEGITSLDINYPKAKINLLSGDGDVILIREYCSARLSDTDKIKAEVNNGTATVTGSTGSGFPFNLISGNKDWLEVTVPRNLLEHLTSLRIQSTQGDVFLPDVTADKVDISTVSGDIKNGRITAKNAMVGSASGSISNLEIKADHLEIGTISGTISEIKFTGDVLLIHSASGSLAKLAVDAKELTLTSISGSIGAQANATSANISTTSGNISAKLSGATTTGQISSVSGNIDLVIPDHSVEVEYSTVSGTIKINTIQIRDKGRITVTTTSGNIMINPE